MLEKNSGFFILKNYNIMICKFTIVMICKLNKIEETIIPFYYFFKI